MPGAMLQSTRASCARRTGVLGEGRARMVRVSQIPRRTHGHRLTMSEPMMVSCEEGRRAMADAVMVLREEIHRLEQELAKRRTALNLLTGARAATKSAA